MVHFCILSNHEGVLAPGRRLYVTLLGSLNLRRPPTAALVAEARRGGGAGQVRPEGLLVTILGGTTLLWPTLAEEYQALADFWRIRIWQWICAKTHL